MIKHDNEENNNIKSNKNYPEISSINNNFSNSNKYKTPKNNNCNINNKIFEIDSNINYNSLFKTYSNAKKVLNFSLQKNSEAKNFNIIEFLNLSSDKKNQYTISNETVYNELLNKLISIKNNMNIEDITKQKFIEAKNNLYFIIKTILNNFANYQPETVIKLFQDLDEIKEKYDIYVNNIDQVSALELEMFENYVDDYNEYLLNYLNDIANVSQIKKYIFLLQMNINIVFNNFLHIKREKNNILLHKNSNFNFVGRKREMKTLEKKERNLIVINKDKDQNINEYQYFNWNKNNKDNYMKNMIPKYIELSVYFSKNEKEKNILDAINKIKNEFRKYLISYKNKKDIWYLKVKFCGICCFPKRIVKSLKNNIISLLFENALIKIYFHRNFKNTLYKTLKKLNEQCNKKDKKEVDKNDDEIYNYFTTNINIPFLKDIILK